jgi:hypothetical protein
MFSMPLLLLLACLVCSPHALGAILQVPAGHPTIQEAVYAAANGDTIHVAPGIYYERLVIPDTSLTICSDDFFTGDSSAINTTILDAQHQGTLVLVHSAGDHVARFDGLTLRNGQGSTENHLTHVGGIQMDRYTNLHLSNVILANHSGFELAGVIGGHYLQPRIRRAVFENVHLITSTTVDHNYVAEVFFSNAEFVQIQRFRYTNGGSRAPIFNVKSDTLIVHDVTVSDLDSRSFGLGFEAFRQLVATSIAIRGSNSDRESILSLWNLHADEGDICRVTDILIEDCTRSAPLFETGQGPVLDIVGVDSLDVQRVTIRNCSTLTNGMVTIIGFGLVRNLLVEDNVAGADPGPFHGDFGCGNDCMGKIVSVSRTNLEDVIIQRNRSILYPWGPLGPNSIEYASGLALRYVTMGPRTFTFKRVIVQDHFTEDHENQLNRDIYHDPNIGRGLYFSVPYSVPRSTAILEDCIFRRIQQPNMCLEWPSDDPVLDGRQVGSVVEIPLVRRGAGRPLAVPDLPGHRRRPSGPCLNDRGPGQPRLRPLAQPGHPAQRHRLHGRAHLFAIDTSWVALQRPKPRPTACPRASPCTRPTPTPSTPAPR